MTLLPQFCIECGKVSPNPQFDLAEGGQIILENVQLVGTCPFCGGMAVVPEGNYRGLLGQLVAAIRQPNVTKEEIERLRDLAAQVESGSVTPEEAEEQARKLPPALAAVWSSFGTPQVGNLLLILSIILMVYFAERADAQGRQQSIHSAQQQQIERTILEELQKLQPSDPAEEKPAGPKARKRKSRPKQSPGANRQAKRDEVAWKRRHRPER
jgi:hypothetical protein